MLPDLPMKETQNARLATETAETPIENLDLSVRVFNSLKRTGVATVGEVLDLLEKGDDAVKSIRNFGEKSLEELREKLHEKGYLKKDSDTE
jgi:DNA-directed RNA polymerase subunit alpha